MKSVFWACLVKSHIFFADFIQKLKHSTRHIFLCSKHLVGICSFWSKTSSKKWPLVDELEISKKCQGFLKILIHLWKTVRRREMPLFLIVGSGPIIVWHSKADSYYVLLYQSQVLKNNKIKAWKESER